MPTAPFFRLYTAHNKGTGFPAYEASEDLCRYSFHAGGCSEVVFPSMFDWRDGSTHLINSWKPVVFNKINLQIKKAGGIELKGRYWSCYDYSSDRAWTITTDPEYNSYYGPESQTEAHYVRAVLTF